MAKGKSFLICVFCFAVWAYLVIHKSRVNKNTVSHIEQVKEVSQDTTPVQCVKKFYRETVGIREEGVNGGDYVNMVMASVGLDNEAKVKRTGSGYYWCAADVCYPMIQCGVNNPKSAWAATVSSYNVIYRKGKNEFPSNNILEENLLVHGIYSTKLKRVSHTGFIDVINDNSSVCVEGNTNRSGYRDGGGKEQIIRPNSNFYEISLYN